MKTLFTSLAIVLTSLLCLNVNAQNKLTVQVTDLEASKGNLMIAIFDSEQNFMTERSIGQRVDINGTTAETTFDNLKPGKYAVIFFQDENNNYNIDLGEMGIPTEKYGFSNNVDPAKIGHKPTFDECSFTIDSDTTITIKACSAVTQQK